jgi:hypothetical protein
MKRRIALVSLGLAALKLLAGTSTVLAQVLPPISGDGTGLGELMADPGQWLTLVFTTALVNLGKQTTTDAAGFMTWLLGNGNVISQTPGQLSYDSDAVIRLWGVTRMIANAGLVIVTVWSGVNLMVQPHVRAPYHGVLELVPRLVLGGILVNTSLGWGHFVIDLNNALCQALGTPSMPAWDMLREPGDAPGLVNLVALIIYLVMGLLLLAQMLMRLALIDVLLVIAPLALLCWVVPQSMEWARMWLTTFFGTVFVQAVQVVVLQLGSDLIQHLPSLAPGGGTSPVDSGRVWLMTLLLGVAILQLARRVPRLMPGYPHGGATIGSPVATVRQAVSLIRFAGGARGGR